jgi:hypothetical protein
MRRLLTFAFLALLFLVGPGQAQAQVDLAGTWELTTETPRGTATSTFTFVQDLATFSGTVQMPMGGRGGAGGGGTQEVEFSDGKIDGKTFTFTMTVQRGERSANMAYAGTVDGDSMEGTVTNPRGETAFTGVRK